MVRYGVQNTNDIIRTRQRHRINRSSSIEDDDSIDEVDNVQSRYCYPGELRRNFSSNSDEVTDDENVCDSSNEEIDSATINEKKSKNDSDFNHIHMVLGIVLIIVVICLLYCTDSNKDRPNQIPEETKFINDINDIGIKYKLNYNSILQIRSAISTTFKRQDAASLIFTYNSTKSNFSSTNFNQFMNDVANTTASFLRNGNNIYNHVVVDATKLNMSNHSELIEKYRNNVAEAGVMLVMDVDEVPSYLAMAFHYYCDEFNPLVEKSAILFTLNMARCTDPKTTHASVEKCLAKKWTMVPKDTIVPLLNRVVNVVVDVTNVI